MKYKKIPLIKFSSLKEIKGTFTPKNTSSRLPLIKKQKSKFFSNSNITINKTTSNSHYSKINYNTSKTITNIKKNITKNSTLSPKSYSPKDDLKFPSKINQEIFLQANRILRHRLNGKITSSSPPHNPKNVIIDTIKEISLRNYHINLLRQKRIDIDNKENDIYNNFTNSSHQLENDYENFLNIIVIHKEEQKRDEEKLNNIKNIYEATLNKLNIELNINKKLNNNIIKVIKLIGIFKSYGSFLHKIYNIPFPYDEITELDNRLKITEDTRQKIIKIFEKNISNNIENLWDVETLMQKFDFFEEKLIKSMSNKEKTIKEYNNMLIENKEEIINLKKKIKIFQGDLNDVTYKKKKLSELMARIFNIDSDDIDKNNINDMQYVDENLKSCVQYIDDIGKALNINNQKNIETNINNNNNINDLQYLKEYINYSKDIIKCLENKENLVNEYTNKIDQIVKNGNYKDKQIIISLMNKMKRDNKFRNIINIKNNKEYLGEAKRINALKRGRKFVLRQNKVFIDIPMKNKNNKTSKINIKANNDNEYLLYSSEESNEEDNNNQTSF